MNNIKIIASYQFTFERVHQCKREKKLNSFQRTKKYAEGRKFLTHSDNQKFERVNKPAAFLNSDIVTRQGVQRTPRTTIEIASELQLSFNDYFDSLDLALLSIENLEFYAQNGKHKEVLSFLRDHKLSDLKNYQSVLIEIADVQPGEVLELLKTIKLHEEFEYVILKIAKYKPEEVLNLLKDLETDNLIHYASILAEIAEIKPEEVFGLIKTADPNQLLKYQTILKIVAKSKPEDVLNLLKKIVPLELQRYQNVLMEIAEIRPELLIELLEGFDSCELKKYKSILAIIAKHKPEEVFDLLKKLETKELKDFDYILAIVAKNKPNEVFQLLQGQEVSELILFTSTLEELVELKQETISTLESIIRSKWLQYRSILTIIARYKPEEVLGLLKELETNELRNFTSVLTEIAYVQPREVFELLKTIERSQLKKYDFVLTIIARYKPEEVLDLLKELESSDLKSFKDVLSVIAEIKPEKVFEFIKAKEPNELIEYKNIISVIANHDPVLVIQLLENLESNELKQYNDIISIVSVSKPEKVLEFIKSRQNYPLKDSFIEYVEKLLFKGKIDLPENLKDTLILCWVNFIQGLSKNEIKILGNTKNQTEFLVNNSQGVLRFNKDGSKLSIYKDGSSTIFVNTILNGPYEVWKKVHDLGSICVAPILENFSNGQFNKDVSSRYCGISLGVLRRDYSCKYPSLVEQVFKQEEYIKCFLDQERVVHGHTHEENFTVEFINREYLESMIKQGYTLNTLPYNSNEFSFNPEEYMLEPEKWKIVVRLIDWDQATVFPKPVAA